jgi:hypothetical protein
MPVNIAVIGTNKILDFNQPAVSPAPLTPQKKARYYGLPKTLPGNIQDHETFSDCL